MGIKDRGWYWDKHDELTGRKRPAAALSRALLWRRSGSRTTRPARSAHRAFPAWLAWLLFAMALLVMLFVGLRGAFHH